MLTEVVGKGKVPVFKNRKVFDQNLRLLVPARIKFQQIRDFNFLRKFAQFGFAQFTTLNSRDF